jgi:hypothetical protein
VHGHVIHDWPEHAPDYTKRRVKGSEEGWAVDDVPESSGCSADRGPGASPEDSEINAALPSSTIPLPSPHIYLSLMGPMLPMKRRAGTSLKIDPATGDPGQDCHRPIGQSLRRVT